MENMQAYWADLYDRRPCVIGGNWLDCLYRDEIEQFRREVARAYAVTSGSAAKFRFVTGQPYDGLEDLKAAYKATGIIYISKDHNYSRVLPGRLNLQFRAVHDYAHIFCGGGFDLIGEWKTFQFQQYAFHSARTRWILFSEVVLQAAYALEKGEFGKQKLIWTP